MTPCRRYDPYVDALASHLHPQYSDTPTFYPAFDLTQYDAATVTAMLEDITSIVELVRLEINGGDQIIAEHRS